MEKNVREPQKFVTLKNVSELFIKVANIFSEFIVREHFIKVTNIFPNSSFANFFWINDIFTVHAPGSLRWQRISVFWYFFIFILCRVLFITHRNSGLFAAYCYGYCLCASWPVRACQGDFGPEWHTYCTLRTWMTIFIVRGPTWHPWNSSRTYSALHSVV